MLSDELFEVWCREHNLSEQAKTLIQRLRSSPPSRLVRGAAGNVSGRYPSQKMGCTIQFESHRGELAFIYQMEHDPTVLEFYDQPEPIKLVYPGKTGRQVGLFHTPDFFVLLTTGAGWAECKMEDQLPQLAEQMPHRYIHNADGTWSCPPGEAYAESLGLFYRIQSSATINWVYQRNLRFLEDYLRVSRVAVETEVSTAIRQLCMSKPALSLLELLEELRTGTPDDLYALIASEQLYVDLSQAPLADPAHVHVFVDREQAAAYSQLRHETFHLFPGSSCHSLTPGTMLWWDGKPWRTLNLGETTVTLLSPEQRVVDLPVEVFEDLLRERKVTVATPASDDPRHAEEHEHILAASPSELEIATYRYKLLGRALPEETTISARTLQRWRMKFRAAEAIYGHGFIGLIPGRNRQGNRQSRLSQIIEQLLEKYITEHYETLKQQSKTAVYLLLEREAKEQGLAVPSYRTFLDRIAKRDRREQILKRQGPRAATQHDSWVWELEQTTPKHGDRPWEIVHMDHTELDIELVSARTGQALGRPWATFVTDAFSRRLLVVYLTFDPPSYRSCMMALRECVWRYGRLPQTLVVDGGPDFRSVYFEALLAYYSCTKVSRPAAKPRYGSVCERLFGTANTQFVHNLIGNTQITKQVRQVTKSVNPKQHAAWTLGDLYSYLMVWAYEVYDTAPHPALDMSPREAFRTGMARSGERIHCTIDFDDTFRFFSLPTTPKGTAQVEPGRGVKINYVYYWSDEFRPAKIEHTQLPVRYDPFDIGKAYAFVQGRWVQCISEYYLAFKGHSERELLLATVEMRKRSQNHTKERSITAKRLAEFLASVQEHEGLFLQRLHDSEAQDVFAQMGGIQSKELNEPLPNEPPPPMISQAEPEQQEEVEDVYAGLEIYEEYQ
jgi:transposase InsO family protein